MIRNYFSLMDGHLQEVMKAAFSALVIRTFGTLLGFSVSVVIARLLGAEGSGIYYLALSVATIAATIGRVGFDSTLVRFIASHASAHEWADVRYIYRVAMKIVSAASLLISVVLFFSASWAALIVFKKPFMEVPLQLAALAVMPAALAMVQAESLRGLKSIPASQWIKTVFVSLGTLLLVYPLVKLWGANGAVAAYLGAVGVTVIVSLILWRRVYHCKAGMMIGSKSMLSGKVIFQSNGHLFGIALMGLAMQQTATILLGVWGSAKDVGVFHVANRIVSLFLFPLMAMISILAPKFAEIYRKGDMKELKNLSQNSSRILTLFVLPVAMLLAIYSELILMIFGPEFQHGAQVANILLIGVVFNVATGAVAELLIMCGYESIVRSVTGVGALIVVIGCFILIPKFGDIGAAISEAAGAVILNTTIAVFVRIKLGFSPIGYLYKKN